MLRAMSLRSISMVLLLLAACARGSTEELTPSQENEIDRTDPVDDAGARLGSKADGGVPEAQADAAAPEADADAGDLASLANGLVFHMTFDSAAPVDASGHHPASTISVTSFTAAPDRFGHPSGAARFNATPSSLIQVGPPNLMPLGGSARSLAAWVRPRIAAPAATTTNLHSNVFLHWGIDDCTSKMFGLGNQGDHGFAWTGCIDLGSTFPVPVATWTFVAMTYRVDGTLTLVVGNQQTARTGVMLQTPASPLAIGGERKTFGQGFVSYFDGDLDDVRVWSRALDNVELTALAADH